MVTAPIVASTALSLVPKAPTSSVLCFALWVTNFQQLCRHGTLRKGTVGQWESCKKWAFCPLLSAVGLLLECIYAEQNSGEHWLCTLPRKPVARTSPQDQSAGAVARTSCQMCSSGNIMPKANLLRAQSITKPQRHASFTREIDEDSLGRSAKPGWTSRFLLIPISFQSSFGWWCPDSLVEEFVHDFNSLGVVRVWAKSVNEIRSTKFAQGFEYTKSAKLFSSSETSFLQFLRIVPTACFGLLSPLRPISFQSGFVWWCSTHLSNSLRVVRVWVKSVNEIRRTKFSQGLEYTKSARLFSSSETSHSAVLSHRSDCLLRTVVPVETDFFSERLCLVMSRLPCRRICPWLRQLESCTSVSKKCEWNQEDKVCARFWVHKKCKVVFKQRDFAFCSSFASFRLLASDCCPRWDRFLFRAVLAGDVPTPLSKNLSMTSTAWELYECE